MNNEALNETITLFRAMQREAPALMMENIAVDSNRGVTSRGNSQYDRYASPRTREKVLEARLQEIEAFARSRNIPTSNIYAIAETALRTGKIPDLGQFGLAGDDAVATKHFLLGNVLNLAGMEWVDYKGDVVSEVDAASDDQLDLGDIEDLDDVDQKDLERRSQLKRIRDRRAIARRRGGFQMSDTAYDPSSFMMESSYPRRIGSGRSYQRNSTLHFHTRSAVDKVNRAVSRRRAKREVEDEFLQYKADKEAEKKEKAKEAERRAHDRWMLGLDTEEESIAVDPSMFMVEGSTKGPYPFARKEAYYRNLPTHSLYWSAKDAHKAAKAMRGHDPTAEAYYLDDMHTILKVLKDRQREQESSKRAEESYEMGTAYLGEEGGPYRTGGAPERAPLSPSMSSSGGEAVDNPSSYSEVDLLPKPVMKKLKAAIGPRVYGYPRHELIRLARSMGLISTEEAIDYRSEADRILGIDKNDPRAEAWPKVSEEMRKLLNLESVCVFQKPVHSFDIPDDYGVNDLEEMTLSSGVGGFMGGGIGQISRMPPSFGSPFTLPEDPSRRIEVIRQIVLTRGPVAKTDGEDNSEEGCKCPMACPVHPFGVLEKTAKKKSKTSKSKKTSKR